MEKANIRLVAIGLEELGYEEFIEKKFFHGELYLDTEAEAFKRLGLKKLGNCRAVLGAKFSPTRRVQWLWTAPQKGIPGHVSSGCRRQLHRQL